MTTASRDDASAGAELSLAEVNSRFAELVQSNFPAGRDGEAARPTMAAVPTAGRALPTAGRALPTAGRALPTAGQAKAVTGPDVWAATPDATRIVARVFGPRDWPATPELEDLEDAQSRFTPPVPHNVMAAADPIRRLAAIGAVGFPLLTILAFVARVALGNIAWPLWPGPIFAVLFVASLLVLLWRMPRDRTDRPDNGAVV